MGLKQLSSDQWKNVFTMERRVCVFQQYILPELTTVTLAFHLPCLGAVWGGEFGMRYGWVHVLILPLTSCVTSGKSLILSEAISPFVERE